MAFERELKEALVAAGRPSDDEAVLVRLCTGSDGDSSRKRVDCGGCSAVARQGNAGQEARARATL